MASAPPSLAWGLMAGAIGFVWGLSEIIGAFKNETGRALRTGGAWLLVWLNFGAAAGIFMLVASVIPEANNWLTAVFVGFACRLSSATRASNWPNRSNLNRHVTLQSCASSKPTAQSRIWRASLLT